MRNILSFLFLCLYFLPNTIYSQTNVDSLLQIINSEKSDKIKVKKLNDLSEELTYVDIDQSLETAKQALQLAKKLRNKDEELRALTNIGICYQVNGKWKKAREYFVKVYNASLEKQDTAGAGNDLINIGITYDIEGYPDSALFYLKKADTLLEASNDIASRIALNTNMGIILSSTGEYDKALKRYQIALELCDKIQDRANKANVLSSIGDIYFSIEDIENARSFYFEAKEIDSLEGNSIRYLNDLLAIGKLYNNTGDKSIAEGYFYDALKLAKEVDYTKGIIFALNNLGTIAVDNEDFVTGKKIFLELIPHVRAIGNIAYEAVVYVNLGGIYERTGEYDNAISYFQQSLEIKRLIRDYRGIFNMYNGLRNCYRAKNEYQTAMLYSDSMLIARDSIMNEVKLKEIAELETKYETEKKEQEIALLNKDKELQTIELEKQKALRKTQLYLFTGLITIIVIISLFLYYRRRLKQKALLEQTLKEQQRIRFSEVVETLEKERKRFASDLHDGLGQILTTAKLNTISLKEIVESGNDEDKQRYQNSVSLIDNACTEIRNIAYDIMPGSLIRLGLIAAIKDMARKLNQSDTISVKVNDKGIKERFSEQQEYNMYRIIQEIINNILKHSDATQIEIQFEKNDDILDIMVIDNGTKIEKEKIINSTGGWRNIHTRITMANARMDVNEKDVAGNIVDLKFMCN